MNVSETSRNQIALAAICLSAAMLDLEITSIPSILPALEKILPADFRQLQWIMNSYTIAMCSTLVAMGAMADRFGRKRSFLIGIVIFGVSSLVCAIADNAPLLIAARFLQGMSAAAMLSCQVAVLSHQFRNGADRGAAFAKWGIVFGLGLGFGQIVGGIIIAFANWEWAFLIHVILSMLTLLLARIGVEESSDPQAARIDLAGMITLSLTVFGFVYLITQGVDPLAGGWGATVLVLSVISLVLFIVVEIRTERPIFDFSAFRIANFSGALIGACGMNFSFWPFIIYFPLYLQSVLGYSGVEAGLVVLSYTLPTIIAPPFAEKILARRGAEFIIPAGLFTIAAGFLLFHTAVSSGHAGWLTLLPGCIIAGSGLGLTNTPVTNTATASLPPERAGMASGMEFSARMISLALNIAIMGFILAKSVSATISAAASELPNSNEIRAITDLVAAGNFVQTESHGISVSIARNAMADGIGVVTLYGAIASLILGIAAWLIFRKKPNQSPLAT